MSAASTYLLPLTGVFPGIAIGGLGLQIKQAGYGPFALGVVSGGAILAQVAIERTRADS